MSKMSIFEYFKIFKIKLINGSIITGQPVTFCEELL